MDRNEPEQLNGAADIGDGIGGGLDALGQLGGNTVYPINSDEQLKLNQENNKKFQNMNFNNQNTGFQNN